MPVWPRPASLRAYAPADADDARRRGPGHRRAPAVPRTDPLGIRVNIEDGVTVRGAPCRYLCRLFGSCAESGREPACRSTPATRAAPSSTAEVPAWGAADGDAVLDVHPD